MKEKEERDKVLEQFRVGEAHSCTNLRNGSNCSNCSNCNCVCYISTAKPELVLELLRSRLTIT